MQPNGAVILTNMQVQVHTHTHTVKILALMVCVNRVTCQVTRKCVDRGVEVEAGFFLLLLACEWWQVFEG